MVFTFFLFYERNTANSQTLMSKHMYLNIIDVFYLHVCLSVFPFDCSTTYPEARHHVCVCCNSLVVLQQNEARGKKESEQASDEWLARRVDRLNSIVQVIITVLLNTSIAAECICLALLSGSVLFKSFIHLGLFLFLPYVCIAHTYKPHLLSIYYFFFEKMVYMHRCSNCCRSAPITGQPRIRSSSIVGCDDGSNLHHIYGAVIVMR
jgi:hypothetical protein